MQRIAYVCLFICASGLLAACGGGGGSSSPTPTPIPTPTPPPAALTLSSSVPANNATNVDRTAAIALTFSAALDPTTVSTNVVLRKGSQVIVTTAATSGSTATLTPLNTLALLTPYAVTAATGLRGTAGGALATAVTTLFTTRDGAWQTAQLIETDNAGDAYRPSIAIDANGNALAVWMQEDPISNIYANRYTPGTGWGTAALIETDNAGNADFPSIAIDANGNALAVWEQSDGTRTNIWANRYTFGTGWGTAALIETDNAGNARESEIAIDANGNALAVWMQYDGIRFNIWANRYTVGTGWGTAALIETAADPVSSPSIAIDANGNALAVWEQSDGIWSIWANRYTSGTGWGTAALIETDNAGNASGSESKIAIDANGNALAVWRQSDGTRQNIYANRYTFGTGWGTAALIETDNAGNANGPSIAIDANGNALAVWRQSDGTRTNIWANRLQ